MGSLLDAMNKRADVLQEDRAEKVQRVADEERMIQVRLMNKEVEALDALRKEMGLSRVQVMRGLVHLFLTDQRTAKKVVSVQSELPERPSDRAKRERTMAAVEALAKKRAGED